LELTIETLAMKKMLENMGGEKEDLQQVMEEVPDLLSGH